jgi:hypothetical protein
VRLDPTTSLDEFTPRASLFVPPSVPRSVTEIDVAFASLTLGMAGETELGVTGLSVQAREDSKAMIAIGETVILRLGLLHVMRVLEVIKPSPVAVLSIFNKSSAIWFKSVYRTSSHAVSGTAFVNTALAGAH